MKTRHRDKTESQLLLAEAELRHRLLELLPRAERTGELLFSIRTIYQIDID